jgi:hypothetical protein
MWGFYGRWLKTALWHGLGPADLWSGLVGALLGVADHYWPHLQLLPLYGWQIPIWAFATFFVGRLVMAPYWMWLEDQKVSPAKVDLAKRKRLSQLRSDGVARRHNRRDQHDRPSGCRLVCDTRCGSSVEGAGVAV